MTVYYSRENGALIGNHKNFAHESLRGILTTEAPKSEKKIQVFINKNTVEEAKEKPPEPDAQKPAKAKLTVSS